MTRIATAPRHGAISTCRIFARFAAGLCLMALALPSFGQDESTGLSGSKVDLSALKQAHQNSVLKIEFTDVSNLSTVKLNPTKSEQYYSGNEPPHGSGFWISETDILTNAHVVDTARRTSIRVKSPATGNVEYRVEVIGLSPSSELDLAVLRMPEDELARFKKRSGLEKVPFLALGDSENVAQADTVAVLGYPRSSDEMKAIEATVTGRQYLKTWTEDWFEGGYKFIEVGPGSVIQPGNSGGPALNAAGEVIGIPSRGTWRSEQGWLIPVNIAKHFLGQIYASEQGRKPMRFLDPGLNFSENFAGNSVLLDVEEDLVVFELGIVAREVVKGGMAESWGLKAGDLIVAFRNANKRISAALDFKGKTVTTGKMAVWHPEGDAAAAPWSANKDKLHVRELFLVSSEGDSITLWIARAGEPGLLEITQEVSFHDYIAVPHLGTYEKPDYELWGEFVSQDFNKFNVAVFGVPREEIEKGGVLVTYVEPNSLAFRRGMKISSSGYGYGYYSTLADAPAGSSFPLQYGSGTPSSVQWIIVEDVNGKPVANLAQFREALREAEAGWRAAETAPGFDPARKQFAKERYVVIGFRVNGKYGKSVRMAPTFPIDEALETNRELGGDEEKVADEPAA